MPSLVTQYPEPSLGHKQFADRPSGLSEQYLVGPQGDGEGAPTVHARVKTELHYGGYV
jgi:hypothetical protein